MDCVVPGVTESWTQLSDLNLLSPSVDRGSVTFAASASTAPQTCLLRLNLTNCDYSAGTKNCVSGNSFQVLYFFCHLPISPPSFPHLFFFFKEKYIIWFACRLRPSPLSVMVLNFTLCTLKQLNHCPINLEALAVKGRFEGSGIRCPACGSHHLWAGGWRGGQDEATGASVLSLRWGPLLPGARAAVVCALEEARPHCAVGPVSWPLDHGPRAQPLAYRPLSLTCPSFLQSSHTFLSISKTRRE